MKQKPPTCAGCPLEKSGRGFAPLTHLKHSSLLGYAMWGGIDTCVRLLIQAEALGNNEADDGIAFAGRSGHLIRKVILPNAGMAESEVCFDNTLRCMPPKSANENYPTGEIRKQAEAHCRQYDQWHLFPDSIPLLCVGGKSAGLWFGTDKIGNIHGHIERVKGRLVGCTFHPAAVQRQYNLLPVVIRETANLIEAQQHPDTLARPVVRQGLVPYHEGQDCVFDLEWNEKGEVGVIGVSYESGIAYSAYGGNDEHPAVEGHVRAGTRIIGHNIIDADFQKLSVLPKSWSPEHVFDTKIVAHLIHAHLAGLGLLGLGDLVRFYRPTPDWKQDKADVLEYNGRDCAYTFRLYKDLCTDLTLTKQWHLVEKQQKLARLAVLMRERGIDIDMEGIRHARDNKESSRNRLREKLPINPNSPAQIVDWARRLGFPIPTASFETINRHRGRNADFDHLIAYREDVKSLSTWFPPDTERLHPSWNVTGTDVARFSCSEPNCQNIPDRLRHLIVAPPGMELVSFDASQIENRCVAWLARDQQMVADFVSGMDIHSLVAARMFGVPLAAVTDRERFEGKTVVHAANYGETVSHLAVRLYGNRKTDSLRRAQKLKDTYFKMYYRTREWQQEVSKQLETGDIMLRNPFGRVRFIYAQNEHERMKRGCHYLGCSTAAEIVNQKALDIWDDQGLVPLLLVHDEVVYFRPRGTDAVRSIIQKILNTPIKEMPDISFPWKMKVGLNYGPYHAETNPAGMR